MRWTERQLAMLREMGVTAFWPVQPAAALPSAAPQAPEVAAGAPGSGGALRQLPQVAEGLGAPLAKPARATPAAAEAVAREPEPATKAPAAAPFAIRPLGTEAMDWSALEAAVAACQACALSGSRRQTVFGVGHRRARWMLVGEAPGEQEDRQGEPFVGRAGQLLDRMLDAIGLTRSEAQPERQVFIANVLKCRPPANRNPLPSEVAQCEPYLLRQLALVQPGIVLAMGRFAAQSLLHTTEPIGRLRGRVHEVAGVPVVVTYHPAYLLRNPADKALVWDDLCLAREVLAGRSAQSPM
jgi:DNA polymerase